MDRNKSPETWITAAPQDTLTTRDENGNLVPGEPATIPFRYRLYWAGADEDGEVAGFYWAVVETVSAPGLPMPPLPGPKPRDYRYTTKRDSVFIFNVFEETRNRQHAFYIYAVDNQGKADPTPARMIFNSLDRFPPNPVIRTARSRAQVFDPNMLDGPLVTRVRDITDVFNFLTLPRDTVPFGSELTFEWFAEQTIADNPAVAFRYKLNEPDFVTVGANVTRKQYNTNDSNRVGAGQQVFNLRAIDQAGGALPQTTRRFIVNKSPDTWFAGPDSAPATDPTFYTRFTDERGRARGRELTGLSPWARGLVPAFPGSYLHPDSVRVLPARRVPNRTFFELYTYFDPRTSPPTPRHRVYVRSEGDTVHMNSWVLLHAGGFDEDSPYDVRVTGVNPDLPGIGVDPVLTKAPANGSPVGFRFRVPIKLDSIGQVTVVSQSQTYPLSDPLLVPEPHIGGYTGMQVSGRAYAIVRAEDGNGGLDNRITDPVAFADSVDRGLLSPSHPRFSLRSRVLTFFVNRAPYLLVENPAWRPRYPQHNGGQVETFFTRTIPLTLSLAGDDDPYQARGPNAQRSVGGPVAGTTPVPVLRFNVQLRGVRSNGDSVVFNPPQFQRRTGLAVNTSIDVPDYMVGTRVNLEIELCDCDNCELFPGDGRCVRYSIPVNVPPPPSAQAIPASGAGGSSEGPGSSEDTIRSRRP